MLQDGESALHKAALEGHVEVVKMLVKYGAAVDIRNKVHYGQCSSYHVVVANNIMVLWTE